MLSKFSVKKPMTVFVSVIAVIILGIVSFTKMTPDLLPNMDLPYTVVLTTYPGQTPETVEAVVSKPLESAISTIDGVKQISSTSADNYSLLTVEFNEGTNMDTATVDMRAKFDTLSGSWGEAVGTPYLIKINPNVLPVGMTTISFEGKTQTELSDYISNELMNTLEGIDGVSSITTKGILTEKENIVISQKKIDKLNKQISEALNSQFADAEDKLNEAKSELDKNIENAKSGAGTIADSIEQINAQQEQLSSQLIDAQSKADSGKTQLLSAKMQLLDQKASLTSTKETLQMLYKTLLSLKSSYNESTAEKEQLNKILEALNSAYASYSEILEQMKTTVEGSDEYNQLLNKIKGIEESIKSYVDSIEQLPDAIKKISEALEKSNSSINNVISNLKELDIPVDTLDSVLNELSSKISQINDGISQIDTAISGLDENTLTVNQALATIDEQKLNSGFKMSSAMANLTAKQSEVNSALTQLNTAEKELESKIDEVSKQKKQAQDKANMSNSVTLDNISGILTAQNFSMPAGYVSDDQNNKYMVRVGNEVANEKEMKSLVLFDTGIDGIGIIKLDDVADVFVSDDSDEVYAKVNGQPGIVMSFSKQSNTATSTVCENINNTLNKLSEENEGLHFTNLYSQGDYIEIVVDGVIQNLLSGAILAIIILLFFLRDIKPTIIVAVSIPISVTFAIVLMYFSGITLNMISLSGLAIGVGMLVDNSVVVIENIYRLRGLGYTPIQSALNGARQISGAIVASTLTTICVFLPIVFVEGITRQIFVDMALTIAYSLIASLIVALTLVPAMSRGMLKKIRAPKNEDGKILKAYEKSLKFVLRHRALTLIVTVLLLVASVLGGISKGFSFMPEMSSTEIQINVSLDKNATFEETVEVAEVLNTTLNEYEEFDTVGVILGSSTSLLGVTGNSSNSAGAVMAYCVLNEDSIDNSEKISKELETKFEKINGDITISGGSTSSMSTLLGDGGVQVILYCDDLDQLKTTAEDMAEKLKTVEGIDETDNGIDSTSPELKVNVDKQKAIEKGLTVAQVYQQIASAISTEKTSTTLTNDEGREIDVVIVKDESNLINPDTLGKMDITYTDKEGNSKKISLSSIAEITESQTMNTISRKSQKRFLTISGTIKEGYTTTEVSNRTKDLFNNYDLPSGASIEYSGSDASTMEAISQMMLMLLLGVILIYLIMVAQFQSLKSPFIIMFTIPLAFTGGFVALLLTGFDISVVSLIGFIMLCGIIVNNGIVLVDYINNLRLEGKAKTEAIVEAGKTRMRPILITALTTVLGLSTMAMGIGTGAEMMQPLAIVCIGGLLYATLMTMYIIPIIYDLFNKKEMKKIDESELVSIDD